MTELDLADIQGNLLRGYRAANVRHLAVGFGDPPAARALLRELLDGPGPVVSHAGDWRERPRHCLNVGLTFAGLRALGVPDATLNTFPAAFRAGAAARALAPDPDGIRGVGLGDVGPSAPDSWELGGVGGTTGSPEVHLMLSLYSDEHRARVREPGSRELRAALSRHGARELSSFDADALPEGRVHFGYRDGISQPRIAGAPGRQPADDQEQMPAGELLLGAGHVNFYGGNHLGAIPAPIADNATYAAFRILAQDVAGFEATLARWSAQWGLDREWLASRIMGRWRDGTPVMTHPDEPEPAPATAALNRFDYGPSAENPLYLDDALGRRCPAGSHIRRLNPRSAPAVGLRGSRRIVRRGMPYGPEWNPAAGEDGVERGLIGLFLCADLELQYEFVLRQWANMDISQPGLRGSREPILGAQPPGGGRFVLRTGDARDPIVLTGLPTLTRTRGSVYCLMPGLGGLRALSETP
jgi:deferrochelatase/peroxidase EfeB